MNQNNRIKALLKKVGLSLVATVAVTTALTGCSNKLTKPNQSQAYQQESSKVPKASPAPQKGIGGITKANIKSWPTPNLRTVRMAILPLTITNPP